MSFFYEFTNTVQQAKNPCGHTYIYNLHCGSLCEETKAHNPVWAYAAALQWADEYTSKNGGRESMGMKTPQLLLYVKIATS